MDHSRLPIALLAVLLWAWAPPSPGAEHAHEHAHEPSHEHEQHAAHVHGEARLLIAIEGEALEIELHSPALNLVGFEHAPATEAQRQAVTDTVALLRQGPQLFQLPAAARCELLTAEVNSPLIEHAASTHGHSAADALQTSGAHSDFSAHYRYHCLAPGPLRRIELTLFAHFPALERIEVQSIAPQGQRQAELTAAQPVYEL